MSNMTKEQLDIIDNFYKDEEKFIYAPDGEILWYDPKSVRVFLKTHPNVFCYTSLEKDDEIWLVEGYQYENSLGFIITNEYIEIPKEGLRER